MGKPEAREAAALPLIEQFGLKGKRLYPSQFPSIYLIRQKIPNPDGPCRIGLLYLDTLTLQSDPEAFVMFFEAFGSVPFGRKIGGRERYIFPQLSVLPENFEELKTYPAFADKFTIIKEIK